MFKRRFVIRPAVIATAVMTAAVLCMAAPAGAAQARTMGQASPAIPHHCPEGVTLYVTSDPVRYLVVSKPHYETMGQGGTTLSLSISKNSTTAGTITRTGGGSFDAIVVSGQASISSAITTSTTTTVNISGTWTVPDSYPEGWLAWGSFGWRYNWEQGTYVGVCKWHETGHGTAWVPIKNTGFFHGKGTEPALR